MSRKTKKLPLEQTFIKVSKLLLQSDAFTPSEKLLISYIISYDTDKTVCFESNGTICFKLNMGLTTVKDTIQKLEDMGLLTKYKEEKVDESGKPFTYRELRIIVKELNTYLYKAEEARNAKIIADHQKKKVKPKMQASKKNQPSPATDQQPTLVVGERFDDQRAKEDFLNGMSINPPQHKLDASRPVLHGNSKEAVKNTPVLQLEAEITDWTQQRANDICNRWLDKYSEANDLREANASMLSDYMERMFYEQYRKGMDIDTVNQVRHWITVYCEKALSRRRA